jgi:RNA polymerase sigma-70 factor (ECF subfamily)
MADHPNQAGARLSSFGAELEVHIASLRRYARALLRNRADAEDLVQEALARANGRADSFQAGTNMRAWLFTILHNVHVNQVRSRASRPDEVPVESVENRLTTPARQEERVEVREMMRALDELPDEQRQVLLLVALEGLKYEEVAEMIGVPIGTVMSRLSRGREAVRAKLANGASVALRRVK